MMKERRRRQIISWAAALTLALTATSVYAQREYAVDRIGTAPTVDGDASDWEGVTRSGDWTLLREPEGTPDDMGWSMAATWDDDALYVLYETNYGGWVQGVGSEFEDPEDCFGERLCGGTDFGGNPDSLNFYIDPNVAGFENDETANGYQFAFGLNEGTSSYIDGAITNTFLFQEAHVATNFGNQGEYGTGEFDGHTLWSFVANVDDNGGVVELRFPWEAFDAPIDEVNHAFAPQAGDVWYANTGIITSDGGNFLPIWSWNESQAFVTRPDGEWTFSSTVVGGGIDGDVNNDGSLDAADLDAIAQLVKDGADGADFDGDGDTDLDDRLRWISEIQGSWIGDSNFDGEFNSTDFVTVFSVGRYETGEAAGYAAGDWNGDMLFDSGDFVTAFSGGGFEQGPRAATAAVPEPASLSLLALAMVSLLGFRKR